MEESAVNDPIDITYGQHYTYADYLRFKMDDMVEIIRGKIFRMAPAPISAVLTYFSQPKSCSFSLYLQNKSFT